MEGVQLYVKVGAPAGVKVYMVPLGKLAAELIVEFSEALLAVDVLAGLNGVTLKKLPDAPEIPIEAVVPDKAALVEP